MRAKSRIQARSFWWCAVTWALTFFLAAGAISGQPQPTAKEIANRVESRYQKVRTMQVTFLERYSQGKNVRIESGTAYFSRPGRMRWEYKAPEEKLFLVDGKNVWFYVPADRTATRAKVKESEDWHTPLALLAGRLRKGTLDRMCEKLELLPTSAGGAAARTEGSERVSPAPSKSGHGSQKLGRQDAGGTEQQSRPFI
ncbi:MAG: outer membrane lipoprotein carrier protein LolA, partial [Acidobacteriales bacterium]|nr:outer membrane lipoprotein carrier protein LolA [Terriglobales bacterium]